MSPNAGGDATSSSGPADTVRRVTGTGVPVRGNDVDTDEIIPARFLKVVTFDGLGQFAFFDERFDSATPEESRDGGAVGADEPLDHPFNEERFQGASVLAVNANFGCGSSREHAPQALMRWGIDAVVGESFAEIFAGNCLALGIPTVTASQEDIEALQDYVDEHPDAEIEVDVAAEEVRYGETTIEASVDDAQRRALVDGVWDTTALMAANADSVEATAASLPYTDD
ncbi:3-isopropylmalate dehydratase small subunit [Halobacterium salinarum]|uniref:3-isopropylmalate dehydratase n=1 Tax=Halobacterium salinarum (strain ATCC 33171 / DSM 3754 / JCM 8978 / NBRC 102687 / NCIMB 764 / 91-R6) TaxID=2597657 RepID=A0A4D6GT44_HALS9|nr:3-isopropylmalate dehydratase small subunit [Halobacterium salinarum]QCC44853.1 3-isopropylmalate dehydratase small subunit [Halobacterium salinarum]TYO75566.1 3-isopropylmalate/(R)-2-methylmalate dehydratase small subunit [Halobacterium salinarum DSM 3754]